MTLHNFHLVIQIFYISCRLQMTTIKLFLSDKATRTSVFSYSTVTSASTDSSLFWSSLSHHLRSHEMKFRIQHSLSCLLSLPKVCCTLLITKFHTLTYPYRLLPIAVYMSPYSMPCVHPVAVSHY